MLHYAFSFNYIKKKKNVIPILVFYSGLVNGHLWIVLSWIGNLIEIWN